MRQGDVMQPLNLLDLFSGIGGFSLGLERSGGFKTAAFCEIEEYPRKVLARHWPEVPCYHDVKELTAERLAADGIGIDAICGGFPCQDLSIAGKTAGIEAERSGLWAHYARLIGELRPRVAFVENVANLISGPSEQPGAWFGKVLGDLASLGYDAEWHCIRASDIGAPHIRDRVWIVAYPQGERMEGHRATGKQEPQTQTRAPIFGRYGPRSGAKNWPPEPGLGRVANGVPNRTHRLKGLGNAVVPQIPEILGRAYREAML